MLYAIIGLLVIIADQWTKFWVSGRIPLESSGEPFIPGVVSLANVHNDGCAFSFLSGSNARIYFIILTGVFTLFVIIALATKLISGKVSRWAIVLVTAGGLSNCIDRVIYGYVQDIFKLEFINFPVFNLADVFITVFAIIFALAIIFGKTRKDVDEYADEFVDYEDEDEEEEEEAAPPISRRKQRKLEKAAARQRKAEEKEEEDEPPVKPAKAKRAERKSEEPAPKQEMARRADRKAEEPAVQPAAAEEPKPAPKKVEDPFAAWERANAKPAAGAPAASAARQQRTDASAEKAVAAAQKAASQPAVKPAAAPAQKPAAAPAKKPSLDEEFSLDDILNEFK